MPSVVDAHSAFLGIVVTLLFLVALLLIAQSSPQLEALVLTFMVALLALAGIMHGEALSKTTNKLFGKSQQKRLIST